MRYAEDRHAGFSEAGERGAAPKYNEKTDRRILALLNREAREGYANWTGPLIVKALGDVNVQYVWRFLRKHKTFCRAASPGASATTLSSQLRV